MSERTRSVAMVLLGVLGCSNDTTIVNGDSDVSGAETAETGTEGSGSTGFDTETETSDADETDTDTDETDTDTDETDTDTDTEEADTTDTDPDQPQCGDGIVAGEEECDDGNDDDTDACPNTCLWPSCGDGFIQVGVEACDLGLLNSDTSACTATCELASCGDGLIWAGVEDCDLGGDNGPTSACLESCALNICGDGFVGPEETCDDSNTASNDGCSAACTVEFCGDGVTQANEECDDGNAEINDGCLASCEVQAVVKADAGANHTCALLDTGSLRCWGLGSSGQLGYVNTLNIGDNETPASAGDVDVGAPITALSLGYLHTCALLEGGNVRCWGNHANGRLGYPGLMESIGDDELLASVGDVEIGGVAIQLASGDAHNCVILEGGTVRCWGNGGGGALGYGNNATIGDNEAPAIAGDVDVGGTVVALALGQGTTCALLEAGNVRCWGQGHVGQLGYANTEHIGDDELPASAGDVDVGGTVVALSSGDSHTCALLEGGSVRCWGYGDRGQLGYGNKENVGDDEAPSAVGDVDVGGVVVQISAAGQHTCALLDTQTVRCWGYGGNGRLGYASTSSIGDNETPATIGDVMVGAPVAQIITGGFTGTFGHTCAVLISGALRCWGLGSQGRLGYANISNVGDNEHPFEAGNVQVF